MNKELLLLGKTQEKLFTQLDNIIDQGINTLFIYDYIFNFISENNLKIIENTLPISINLNNIVFHGQITSHILKKDDIFTIDICFADSHNNIIDGAKTYLIGKDFILSELIDDNKNMLKKVISTINVGVSVHTVIEEISNYVNKKNYFLYKGGMGHGISEKLHSTPFLSLNNFIDFNYIFKKGDLFTLEPILFLYKDELKNNFLNEGYIRSDNRSSQFEVTIYISDISDIKVLNYGLLN